MTKPYGAQDFQVGDEVAVWGTRSFLPVKHVVVKSNSKFFTTDKDVKFSHSSWDKWGSSSGFKSRAERWNEKDYQERLARKNAEERREALLHGLQNLHFAYIEDNDDLQHVLDFCSTMIDDWKQVREEREKEREFQRRRQNQIEAVSNEDYE